MKKLLIGLLVLVSFSGFATEITDTIKIAKLTESVKWLFSYTEAVLGVPNNRKDVLVIDEANNDLKICISNGYDKITNKTSATIKSHEYPKFSYATTLTPLGKVLGTYTINIENVPKDYEKKILLTVICEKTLDN